MTRHQRTGSVPSFYRGGSSANLQRTLRWTSRCYFLKFPPSLFPFLVFTISCWRSWTIWPPQSPRFDGCIAVAWFLRQAQLMLLWWLYFVWFIPEATSLEPLHAREEDVLLLCRLIYLRKMCPWNSGGRSTHIVQERLRKVLRPEPCTFL